MEDMDVERIYAEIINTISLVPKSTILSIPKVMAKFQVVHEESGKIIQRSVNPKCALRDKIKVLRNSRTKRH